MMRPYVLENMNSGSFMERLDEIAELYHEYGVVILPKFFKADPVYQKYISDLERIFDEVIQKYAGDDSSNLNIGEKLTLLAAKTPEAGKIITDLGTQQNKFFSFGKIKYAEFVSRMLCQIWGDDAIPMTPQAGDTLHFFPPGKQFHKYNLPPHQDYQYLMQSPQQITLYFGISDYANSVGGLKIWEKSHKLGILKSCKNENGSFEIHDWENALNGLETYDYEWNQGDFGLFDSLLAHSSIPNTSDSASRIVQIFRYSNINNDTARAYDYYSTVYNNRRGIDFTEKHPDLYTEGE